MPRVTITIEGEFDEIQTILQRLATGEPDNPVSLEEPVSAPIAWTPEELAALWNMIESGARGILAEIATRPDGYPFTELQHALGMNGSNIAGRLSSVGHAMRRFPEKPHPVTRDYRTRQYTIDAEVADVIRRLARGGGEEM